MNFNWPLKIIGIHTYEMNWDENQLEDTSIGLWDTNNVYYLFCNFYDVQLSAMNTKQSIWFFFHADQFFSIPHNIYLLSIQFNFNSLCIFNCSSSALPIYLLIIKYYYYYLIFYFLPLSPFFLLNMSLSSIAIIIGRNYVDA